LPEEKRVYLVSQKTALLLLFVLSAVCLDAQLNVLTLREAESLVERVPDVVGAQKNGECPNLSPSYDAPGELAFQVRSTCGPGSGMLIGNYTVNRRTGAVTLWGDDPKPVADAEGEVLAKQLIAQAWQRILSAEEARCLALAAARSLPGWSETDANVSVKPFGKANRFESTMQFTATRSSSARPAQSGRMLTVNVAAALVRDDETGLNIMSAALGALTSKMVGLRAPPWLTDEDALSVGLLVSSVAASPRDGCKLYTGGAFYSHQAIMGVSCPAGDLRDSNVLVNLQTGEAKNPDTGKSLDSAESGRVARKLLEQIKTRRAELQKEVEAACRPSSSDSAAGAGLRR
jgi:hypothetical protein